MDMMQLSCLLLSQRQQLCHCVLAVRAVWWAVVRAEGAGLG